MARPMVSKTYLFDPRPYYPLVLTAKRYWQSHSPDSHREDALTLVFAHGTGFHKEQWEPTIDDLMALVKNEGGKVHIRELWSIECPNHGDSAALNEQTLKWGYEPIFGWEEYARAIHTFLGGHGTGVDVDFRTHKLVGIGHSMGAASLLLTVGYLPRVKFESFIFVEIMSMAERFTSGPYELLVGGASKRRDIWPSREEAYTLLKSRSAWKVWDDRVLRIFVEQGMCPLPTSTYPDKTGGVTLKCPRSQETACYRDHVGASRVYRLIGPIAKLVPIHLIYGAVNDYLPKELKEDFVDVAVGGMHNLASFSTVPNAGHLAVQMNPKGLAEKIYRALFLRSGGMSKL